MEKVRLGEALVAAGVVAPSELRRAIAHQLRYRCKLGEALLELKLLSPEQMLQAVARQLRVPYVRAELLSVSRELVQKVPASLLTRYRICPVRLEWTGGTRARLTVATSQPENLAFLDEVAFATRCQVVPVLALASEIERALRQHGVLARGNDPMELPPFDEREAFVILRSANDG